MFGYLRITFAETKIIPEHQITILKFKFGNLSTIDERTKQKFYKGVRK
jgi:hypothetical protein